MAYYYRMYDDHDWNMMINRLSKLCGPDVEEEEEI